MRKLDKARSLASDLFVFFHSRSCEHILTFYEAEKRKKQVGELLNILDEIRVIKKKRKRIRLEERKQRIANEIIEMEQSLAMHKSAVGIKLDKIFSDIHEIAENVIKNREMENENRTDERGRDSKNG